MNDKTIPVAKAIFFIPTIFNVGQGGATTLANEPTNRRVRREGSNGHFPSSPTLATSLFFYSSGGGAINTECQRIQQTVNKRMFYRDGIIFRATGHFRWIRGFNGS